jgi:hypothetical protein
MLRAMLHHLVALACTVALPLAQFDHDDAAAGWHAAATAEGLTLQERAVAGSSFREYRALIPVALPPARVADEIWRVLRDGDMDSLKRREILRASDGELLIYDQIRTPIVSDRDYTIRVRRVTDGARTQFRCETANELGPPPARGHVRIPIIRAGWMTAPDGNGTLVTYYAFSEPGGSVPAFLVRRAQRDRSLADIVRMARRLRRLSP